MPPPRSPLTPALPSGPTRGAAVDPRTIYPVLPRLLCCLPPKYRQWLGCGVPFPAQVRTPGPLAGGWVPAVLLPPALSLQDAARPELTTTEKVARVPNGVAAGCVPRDEEEQGYVRAAGPPAYALQETSF